MQNQYLILAHPVPAGKKGGHFDSACAENGTSLLIIFHYLSR